MKHILTTLLLVTGLAQAAPMEICNNQWSSAQNQPQVQSRFTVEQQAKDTQQQAKDAQQAAKDKQQEDTDARQIAFGHMLDQREFTYNSQKPSPSYKCLRPCCNGQVAKEQPKTGCYTAPIAGFCVGKKPQEPACPLIPKNTDTKSVKEHNDRINEWSKEHAQYLKDLTVYNDQKLKNDYQDQKDAHEKEVKDKEANDKEHTNSSGGGDNTNPGGGGNENGVQNPGYENHIVKGL